MVAAGSLIFLVTACMTSDDDVVMEGQLAEPDPSEVFFTRTSVTLSPDGNHQVFVTQVSLAQQIAEREAEEAGVPLRDQGNLDEKEMSALALSQDNCTYLSSLRLWSGTNYTGHQLCLTGTGSAALSNWSACGPLSCCPWGGYGGGGQCHTPVQSFKTGIRTAVFSDTHHFWCQDCTSSHDASTSVADADSCVEEAMWVGRHQSCSPG